MDTVKATRRFEEAPRWATQERKLIDFLNTVTDPVIENYVTEDGSLLWPPSSDYVGIDGHDDAYESFWNWPLFYVIGGDDRFLEIAQREYEAILEQFADIETPYGHPMAVDEYEQCRDWFHHAEGNLLFYFLCLADPNNENNMERAQRFAEFYFSESDTGNYDADKRIVKSPMTGSMGPEYCDFSEFTHHSYGADYIWEMWGLPFQDIPSIDSIADITDPANEDKLFDVLKERCSRGDVPLNLGITGLMANAYLLTGDELYREWVQKYVNAWIERTEDNDGIIPDNVGVSGEVGEYIDGKWYGGFYGWSWLGWHGIGAAVTVASETSTLLTGDQTYLDLLRSQIDMLLDNAIERSNVNETNETLYIPHRYGDPGNYHFNPSVYGGGSGILRDDDGAVQRENGWFYFHPVTDASYPTHLWYASLDQDDRERLQRTRNYETRAWENPEPTLNQKYIGGHEHAWEAYLNGEFPEYPETILHLDRYQSLRRIRRMEDDEQDPETFDDNYLQQRNPVVEEGLLQLTMGAPQPVYNGGLLMAHIRHFDPERERPGLPRDTAALVSRIEDDRIRVEIVNIGSVRRDLLVQAGAYGEHRFTFVNEISEASGDTENDEVDENNVQVVLSPKTHIRLDLGIDRFVNDPSYAFPSMSA